MKYIESIGAESSPNGCFLCRYRNEPECDQPNCVLWRSDHTLVLLNRYPYTNGHLLIAPTAHIGNFDDLPETVLIETILRIRDAKKVLQAAVAAQGFNIGINLGHCAGAGLPEHLHWHIVPRWSGDTNFMASVGDVRLIPQALEAVRDRFLEKAHELDLK